MNNLTKNPMYRFLILLTIASTFGLQTWHNLFNNFAVEVAGLEGYQIGIIQSVREIPGFLTFLVIYIIIIMKEHRLSVISILAMGIGLVATGYFPTHLGLLFTTLLLSFGFHYYETTNQSLTLQYFDLQTSPWVLGKLRSYAAASNIGIGILIYLMSMVFDYGRIYLVVGCMLLTISLWGFFQDPTDKDIIPQQKKMIIRKKYWLYYFLTFMAGARRQIFATFAVFLLVKEFHFSIQEVTILMVINNVINYFLSPMIGKSVIRFGERKILSIEYFSLIFIFIAYANVQAKTLLWILFILDHILINFALAIRTYFQKIGDPKDIAPSMAVGFTINHIVAVILPALGGFLWMVDYRIVFYIGAFFSLISLTAVQKIRYQRSLNQSVI